MNEQGFIDYLKRQGCSHNTIKNCVELVNTFAHYLLEHKKGKPLQGATAQDLEDFALWGEGELKSLNTHLLALCHYYEYTADETMRRTAADLREPRLRRSSIPLKAMVGISQAYIERLAAVGITSTKDLLLAGRTRGARKRLSLRTGIPPEAILELVKLSDLARVPGVKRIRARLYFEAGVDTVQKLAAWDPEALREMLIDFVRDNDFEGTVPWPEETRSVIMTAQTLSALVEY